MDFQQPSQMSQGNTPAGYVELSQPSQLLTQIHELGNEDNESSELGNSQKDNIKVFNPTIIQKDGKNVAN